MLRFVYLTALIVMISLTSCTSCKRGDSQPENVNPDAGTKIVYTIAPTELFINTVRKENVTSDE
ncbi:MAG: hypothetical protein MJ052_02975, partial [Sphaerochaetaceae bacterium]|nr:hypothetical protein [Sphaerochaetaceae bacterium]